MCLFFLFFFNDTATTEIYTLSLHDALPIYRLRRPAADPRFPGGHLHHHRGPVRHRRRHRNQRGGGRGGVHGAADRKSTRLNSSHANISYAVFCLKKKKKNTLEYSARSSIMI